MCSKARSERVSYSNFGNRRIWSMPYMESEARETESALMLPASTGLLRGIGTKGRKRPMKKLLKCSGAAVVFLVGGQVQAAPPQVQAASPNSSQPGRSVVAGAVM